MNQPWTAEREVSPALAQALIETQFGDLKPAVVECLGVGWDNTAFLVNGVYVFRFPRRQIAVDLIETESRLLPLVARHVPLPVPVPVFAGQPDERFPWPFAGYRMLPGRTACSAGLNEQQRIEAAEPIARFLAALHAIPPEEAARRGVGPDTLDRLSITKRSGKTRQCLEQLVNLGLVTDCRPWLSLLDVPADANALRTPALLHGDLYVRHLLVDAAGRLAGVIDWGDLHLGHPAVDLSIAHGFLPPCAQDVFRRSYGPIDADTWALARFRALDHTVRTLVFAHAIGDRDLVREGLLALRHLA
jgi:aminoglycoside phosphotransferase (APT) family kinase protein